MTYEYGYETYFKDEYGFPLSLSESMKYCELDKVPCLKCEESGKSFTGISFRDRYCPICYDIILSFLEVLKTARRPKVNGRQCTLRRKEDSQVGHICYKLVEKELELFRSIDSEFKSWELCHYAVVKDPSMIQDVPYRFKKKGKLIDYSSIIDDEYVECVIL